MASAKITFDLRNVICFGLSVGGSTGLSIRIHFGVTFKVGHRESAVGKYASMS